MRSGSKGRVQVAILKPFDPGSALLISSGCRCDSGREKRADCSPAANRRLTMGYLVCERMACCGGTTSRVGVSWIAVLLRTRLQAQAHVFSGLSDGKTDNATELPQTDDPGIEHIEPSSAITRRLDARVMIRSRFTRAFREHMSIKSGEESCSSTFYPPQALSTSILNSQPHPSCPHHPLCSPSTHTPCTTSPVPRAPRKRIHRCRMDCPEQHTPRIS